MGCNKILCSDNLVPDISEQKIFFGEYSGFQRYDQPKYPFAVNLEEKMRNAFWNPKEISLVSDRIKFEDLPEFAQEIEIEILLFQTLMDSGNNRGIDNVLSTIVSSPEFEALYKTHAYFELIHSLSYSHILREVFPDATSVFNSLKNRKAIQKRIDKEVNAFEAVASLDMSNPSDENKKIIIELLIRIYVLESIKFYISFLVTYVINNAYHNRIQGIARIIKLINFDEDIHVAVMAGTLNILKKEPSEGFKHLMDSEWYTDKVTEIFTEVVNDELEWGAHLLTFGNIPTLTMPVMDNFIKYYAHERAKKIANVSLYPTAVKSDVESWFESYKDINKDNTAQQEAEATNYNIGILQDDLPEGELSMDSVFELFMGKYNGKKE
jgi:ribonucleoside-diphosphate reductase beta chain